MNEQERRARLKQLKDEHRRDWLRSYGLDPTEDETITNLIAAKGERQEIEETGEAAGLEVVNFNYEGQPDTDAPDDLNLGGDTSEPEPIPEFRLEPPADNQPAEPAIPNERLAGPEAAPPSPLDAVKVEAPTSTEPAGFDTPDIIEQATAPENLELFGPESLDSQPPKPDMPVQRQQPDLTQSKDPVVRASAKKDAYEENKQKRNNTFEQNAFPWLRGGFSADAAAIQELSKPLTDGHTVSAYSDQMADAAEGASESLAGTLARITFILLDLKGEIDNINEVLDRSFGG